ncbi:glycosyltransferase, partial [Arthrobacter sp. I2-34]
RNKSAHGVAAARNQGLDAATGRYITFLDPDDWYVPGHLEVLAREIQRLGVDFLRVDHIRHTRGVRTMHRAPQGRRDVALDPREGIMPIAAATMVDYPFVWAGIFDRNLLDSGLLKFMDGARTAEDRLWTWNLHLNADSYAVVDAPGIIYRRGVSTSLTQVFDERQLDFLLCYLEIFSLVNADTEAERFWHKAARQFYAMACHHLKRANGMTADVRSELQTGIAMTMSRIPANVNQQGLRSLDPARRRMLMTLPEGVLQ